MARLLKSIELCVPDQTLINRHRNDLKSNLPQSVAVETEKNKNLQ